MNPLLKKLLKTTKIKSADILTKSAMFVGKDVTSTSIPAINIALSGDIDGGLCSGLLSIAANSRHFKTSYAMVLASAYLNKHPDSMMIYYDSEFASSKASLESFGIDTDRVLHIPITNIEEFTFDVMQKFDNDNPDGIKRGDKVFIVVDSIGNLASVRESDNAIEGNSALDMTRAKALKSTWRMITPHLTLKNITMVVIQHVYEEMKLYGKQIMGGGCCFYATEVKMADGTLKEIQDIQVGDKVITLKGDKEVTKTWNPDTLENGTPECYKVTFEDGHSIICSDNHKFLYGEYWIHAKDVIVGLDLATI